MFILVRVTVYLFLIALSATSLFSAMAGDGPRTSNAYSDCGPEWQMVPGPANEYAPTLFAVDGVSGSDVWAIGYRWSGGGSVQPAITHWDGNQWSLVPVGIANWYNYLYGVAAISRSDVWAVGWSDCEENCDRRLLIEHWNGSQWGIVSGPGAPIRSGALNAVDGIESNDVWAVGEYVPLGGPAGTLVVHWDGNEWSVVPSTNLDSGSAAVLTAVDAVSATDVWAVGYYPGSEYHSIVGHWDGNSWSLSSAPNVGTLLGVKAISTNDVWAVGSAFLHWDGTTWSVVPDPASTAPVAIDGTSADDVWAVGSNLVEHWDGSAWSVMSGPDGHHRSLAAVYAAAAGDVWSVGSGDNYLEWGLEHYYPVTCPPPCPSERFTDVCTTDYFYQHVLDLNDLGVLSGYNSAPPCDGTAHIPCFKPYNLTTRGQVSKIISLAAGFNEPVSGQDFEDVPPDHTFYLYVGRMAARGIVVGYACGGAGEPCSPENRPYFRVGATVNRAQLSKMTALSFGLQDPVSGQTFQDVVPANHFYPFIENLASHQIINGYPCGGAGEPCIPPQNRPYFRYGNPITRGQVAKIVNIARLETMPSPTPSHTPTVTSTPAATQTTIPTAEPQSPTPESTLTVGKRK
ncbi:MAG: S-layer homology domain-containing protein [Chloroflexota bacterium]